MMRNITILKSTLLLQVVTVLITFVIAQNGFFKVPLEIREKNRPVRKVDENNDPDLGKLKVIQDQFFDIIKQSPIGKKFKSMDQVYSLLLSPKGEELGKLALQGLQLGMWRKDSSVLLTEFIDDFQYRVSAEFGDALNNYIAFIKTIDLRSMPMALDLLFKKDQLGNSLASMPMGQLVDMIQQETSKYGIDARKVINGIIGKDASSLPQLIDTLKTSISKYFSSKTVNNDANEAPTRKATEDKAGFNSILQLFKPSIGHLLKENNIDLDPEAVIHVASHFITQGMQSVSNFIPDSMGSGGNFDFTTLIPLIGLYLNQVKYKEEGSQKNPNQDLIETAMSFMNALDSKDRSSDKNNIDVNPIMSLINKFTNSKQDGSGKNNMELLNAAMNIFSEFNDIKSKTDNKKKNILDDAVSLMNKMSKSNKKSGDKSNELLGLALNLLSEFSESKDKKTGNGNADLMNIAGTLLSNLGDANSKSSKNTDLLNAAMGMLGQFSKGMNSKDKSSDFLSNAMKIMSKLGNDNANNDDILQSVQEVMSSLGGMQESPETNASDEGIDILDSVLDNEDFRSTENEAGELEYKIQDTVENNQKTKTESGSKLKREELNKEKQKKDITKNKENANDRTKIEREHKDTPVKRKQTNTLSKTFINEVKKLLNLLKNDKEFQKFAYSQMRDWRKMFLDNVEKMKLYLGSISHSLGPDLEYLLNLLTFAEDHTADIIENLKDDWSRKAMIERATNPSVELISLLISDDFVKKQSEKLSKEIDNYLKQFGLQGVTLNNFVDRLSPMLSMITMSLKVKIDNRQILSSVQKFLFVISEQWTKNRDQLKGASKNALRIIVAESLENDFASPILDLSEIDEKTRKNFACLPRAVCEYIEFHEQKRIIQSTVFSAGSLLYGYGRMKSQAEFPSLIDMVEATLDPENCNERFPISCMEGNSETKEQSKSDNPHTEL